MLVNVTPMPILGRINATLPSAVNVAPSWEMRTRTCVPCGVGFSMSRKHPPILRSGFGDELCVGRNLSYYCLCDEWVAWSLTALGVHSSRLSFVAKAASVVTFSAHLRFSLQVSQSVWRTCACLNERAS